MKKLTASILSATLMLSMVFSSSVFAANDATTKASAWDSFVGLFTKATATTETANVQYRGHVQDYGDVPTNGTWIQEDSQLGTTGECKRIEGFKIELTDGNTLPAGTQIRYNVHVENEGWLHDKNDIVNTGSWEKDGAFAGSVAKSQRVEAIEIVLTDANGVKLEGYSVQYMVHVENLGWSQGWVADGAIAGTEGRSFRLEAIRIKITQTKADLTEYNAALAKVAQADYTTASWTTYQAVVNANKVTADNTQTQVNTATANITAAQANLVLIPKVASVTVVDALHIKVTYNTAMDVASASTPGNYTLAQGTNVKNITGAELSADLKEVTLTLNTNSPITNADLSYTVTVNNVKDTISSTIKNFSGVYTLSDKVRPVVGDLAWDDSQTLSFTIDKDINADLTNLSGSANNINKYVAVYDSNGINVFGFSATAGKANYYQYTTKPNKVTVNVAGLTEGNYTLKVLGLTDYATNLVSPNPTDKAFTVTKDVTAPTITSITPIGYSGGNATFDVLFSEKLNGTPSIDIDDSSKTVTTVNTSADGKTLTLSVPVATSGLHKVTVKNFSDLSGNAGTAVAQMVTFSASTPQLVSAQYKATATGNKVIVDFDRSVQASTLGDLTSGSYTVSNVLNSLDSDKCIKLQALMFADIDNDGLTELLINADNGFTTTGTTTRTGLALPAGNFSVKLPAALVKDSAAQDNKELNIAFTVPAGTTTATTVTDFKQVDPLAATGDADYVFVNFSTQVADASALTTSNYAVEGQQIFTNAVFTTTAKDQVRLTTKAGAIATNGNYTVSVNNVLDKNGNAVDAYSVAKPLFENVRPVIAKAEITANNNVKVTFSEVLTTVTTSDMEVWVNGSKVAITSNSLTSGNSVANIVLTSPLSSTSGTVVVKTASTFDAVDANFNVAVTGSEKTAVWNVVADTTAPTVTAAAQTVTNAAGQTVNVTNNETGSVYIIKDGEPQATVANFNTAIAADKGATGTVVTAGTAVAVSTEDLIAGTYHAYAVDTAGNISTVGANAITVNMRTPVLNAMVGNAGLATGAGNFFVASTAGADATHTILTFTYGATVGGTLEYAIVADGTSTTGASWTTVPATTVATSGLTVNGATDDVYVRIKAVTGVSNASAEVKALDTVTVGP